jgi:hypothetical protein
VPPLTPNSPRKRLEYALKQTRDPVVIRGTAIATVYLMGLEEDHKVREAIRAWPQHQATRGRAPIVEVDTRQAIGPPAEAQSRLLLGRMMGRLPEHHQYEALIPWFARELSKVKKLPGATYGDYYEAEAILRDKGSAIGQWAKETRADIGRVSLPEALDAIATYKFKQAHVPQGEVVYTFSDGWTVQGLRSEEQLGVEGKMMQHCVGAYCAYVTRGTSRIFSLRDPVGNPHVTIEWRMKDADTAGELEGWDEDLAEEISAMSDSDFLDSPRIVKEGSVVQVYGKQNAPPADMYKPYAQEFIKKRMYDDPIGLVLSGVPAKNIRWRGVNIEPLSGVKWLDFSGTDLRSVETGTEYEHGVGFVFAEWKLDDASLPLHLNMAMFTQVSAVGANFDGCDAPGANFTDCDLSHASFRRADLDGSMFELCNLEGIDISGADLEGVEVETEDGVLHGSEAGKYLRFGTKWDEATKWPHGMTIDELSEVAENRGVRR